MLLASTLKPAGYFLQRLKMEFSKPATTFDEQIALLKKRGMQIDDPDQARYYLGPINYYRLRAYWLPFESDRVAHRFLPVRDSRMR